MVRLRHTQCLTTEARPNAVAAFSVEAAVLTLAHLEQISL